MCVLCVCVCVVCCFHTEYENKEGKIMIYWQEDQENQEEGVKEDDYEE